MSTPKKPTPTKSKKPAVEFEISEEDLDKASGGAAMPYTTAEIMPVKAVSLAGCGIRRR
jgi:hypothetical protein